MNKAAHRHITVVLPRRIGENGRALREKQYPPSSSPNRQPTDSRAASDLPTIWFSACWKLVPPASKSHRGCAVLCSFGGFHARVLVLVATCFNFAQAGHFPYASIPTNSGDSFAAGTFARRSSPFAIPRTETRNSKSRHRLLSAESGGPAAVRNSMR